MRGLREGTTTTAAAANTTTTTHHHHHHHHRRCHLRHSHQFHLQPTLQSNYAPPQCLVLACAHPFLVVQLNGALAGT